MPTFNRLQALRECLESIRLHTACPHEVIVVSRGSGVVADQRLLGERRGRNLLVIFDDAGKDGKRVRSQSYL